jgi:hypothetical protein
MYKENTVIEDNKYNSDKAEPQLNTNSLDILFNVDRTSKSIAIPDQVINTDTQLQEIEKLREEIKVLAKNAHPDADTILHQNIERANRILDKAEESFLTGGLDNRRIEVMAGLINAITTASSSIMGESYNQQVLEHKSRELDIKEQQVALKDTLKGGGRSITQNNIIISSREDLLKQICELQAEDAEDAEIVE